MWHNGAHLADLEAHTLRTPQSTAAKQPGINPDQKKQAMRHETPKMDRLQLEIASFHKFPLKVKKSMEASISTVVLIISRHPISPGAFSAEIDDLDDTPTALRRYGATALARPRGRCAQCAAHRRCPADITSSNSHHGCFNKCWDDQC